ncbi:unnamed protein product, partial [Ixodes persulcatus]
GGGGAIDYLHATGTVNQVSKSMPVLPTGVNAAFERSKAPSLSIPFSKLGWLAIN